MKSTNCLSFPTLSVFQDADVLLIVGANPRYEAPLVNARIRKGYEKSCFHLSVRVPF